MEGGTADYMTFGIGRTPSSRKAPQTGQQQPVTDPRSAKRDTFGASRRYLFVAIDRATRWVFIRVFKTKAAANARRFLRDLERACPLRIRTIRVDNVLCRENLAARISRLWGIRITGCPDRFAQTGSAVKK